MPKWLSMARNWFTAGGFSSNPIPVRVCAEQPSSLRFDHSYIWNKQRSLRFNLFKGSLTRDFSFSGVGKLLGTDPDRNGALEETPRS